MLVTILDEICKIKKMYIPCAFFGKLPKKLFLWHKTLFLSFVLHSCMHDKLILWPLSRSVSVSLISLHAWS